MSTPRLNVVGAGRAGGTIAAALVAAGRVELAQVANRSAASSARAARRLGGRAARLETLAPAEWWLIGVPDDAIGPTVAALAARLGRQDCLCFHLSGATGAGVLDAFATRPAGFHPVRAFPSWGTGPPTLAGTHVGVEGAPGAVAPLECAARALGMVPFRVPPGARAGYHAACSIASNFPVALAAAARAEFERAGINRPTARRLTATLLDQAVQHLARAEAAEALTGPIARGDYGTVGRQLAAVHPARRELFVALARSTLALAGDRLEPRARAALEALLAEGGLQPGNDLL